MDVTNSFPPVAKVGPKLDFPCFTKYLHWVVSPFVPFKVNFAGPDGVELSARSVTVTDWSTLLSIKKLTS